MLLFPFSFREYQEYRYVKMSMLLSTSKVAIVKKLPQGVY